VTTPTAERKVVLRVSDTPRGKLVGFDHADAAGGRLLRNDDIRCQARRVGGGNEQYRTKPVELGSDNGTDCHDIPALQAVWDGQRGIGGKAHGCASRPAGRVLARQSRSPASRAPRQSPGRRPPPRRDLDGHDRHRRMPKICSTAASNLSSRSSTVSLFGSMADHRPRTWSYRAGPP